MGGRSDYEERRKRRIERYKELSLKAQERSSQYSNSNANRILQIAPGQPILVGHHSEKRHRRLIKKAQDDIRKSIEEDNKSNFYKERAENAENSKVIYSDDPQAIIKLKEKLERLENEKASIKAREHSTWELTNIGATIRETKKRIERLEKLENTEFKEINFENGKVIHNKEINRIQFLFDNIPDEDTRKILKSHGFRWSRYEKAWQRVFNLNCIRATNIIVKEIAEKSKEKEEDEEFE
ncbi:MAG: DUF3560 domain-containing protein [Clostridia bacterium]|jgi:hypothetical protein|nr:putative uncharacterized protein [Clostridium sp. CAG:921]